MQKCSIRSERGYWQVQLHGVDTVGTRAITGHVVLIPIYDIEQIARSVPITPFQMHRLFVQEKCHLFGDRLIRAIIFDRNEICGERCQSTDAKLSLLHIVVVISAQCIGIACYAQCGQQ